MIFFHCCDCLSQFSNFYQVQKIFAIGNGWTLNQGCLSKKRQSIQWLPINLAVENYRKQVIQWWFYNSCSSETLDTRLLLLRIKFTMGTSKLEIQDFWYLQVQKRITWNTVAKTYLEKLPLLGIGISSHSCLILYFMNRLILFCLKRNIYWPGPSSTIHANTFSAQLS